MAKPTLLLLAVLLTAIACRPTPNESVEYLHREDAIIIQMLAVGEEASEIDRALAVPEFTLYGDGTLIYQKESADGTRLLRTLLPGNAVQALLEAIVDEGFLDFAYAQPAPGTTSDETTFIYVHTRERANAVTVQNLNLPLTEDAGDEFDQYRRIQTFVEMLRSLDSVALGGTDSMAYLPAAYLGITRTLDDREEVSERVVPADEVLEIIGSVGKGLESTLEELKGPFVPGPSRPPREISFAPLPPFHENFPEFDLE